MRKRSERSPYLAQRTLQFSKEVVVAEINGGVVNVVNSKFQLLHNFKVVVNDKLLCKLGVEAILDLLGAAELLRNTKLLSASLPTQQTEAAPPQPRMAIRSERTGACPNLTAALHNIFETWS